MSGLPERPTRFATDLAMEDQATDAARRLEALRAAIRAESISYGEIAELQSLAPWIGPGDVELAEWAAIPEAVFRAHSDDPRPVTYTDAEIEAARAEERGGPDHQYEDPYGSGKCSHAGCELSAAAHEWNEA